MDFSLELIVLPVSDVDRAKAFYVSLGFRLDVDYQADDYRVVHLTPPGSATSILFGTGVTTAPPGSVRGLHLIVKDLPAAVTELAAAGIPASTPFHDKGGVFHHTNPTHLADGPHPTRASYGTFATFHDPDGNEWFLQEITERLPGR
ncbi:MULTISPECIES: VOC family protein [unclassified Amycolatopsis]|uniref:VOC family protein n=1 Tax=unclassified Amycolatopsis TaxID=2618356 RepID=UPI001C6A05F1|nr:VOC family protein [Amycolatopsis sp. DSM 110486]QYN23254.1 VOC family protein [Amycolatopsis sp. DSM 110486]